MVKMCLYPENEVPSCSDSKGMARTDTQTDPTEIITYPHMHIGTKYDQDILTIHPL